MKWFRRKKYLFGQMVQHKFVTNISACQFSYLKFKLKFLFQIYNTMCWYSGKDTGLSPGRPQFKPLHYQGFLIKDLPWKFFKKWLSIRRITIWITSKSQSLPTPVREYVIWFIFRITHQNTECVHMCTWIFLK